MGERTGDNEDAEQPTGDDGWCWVKDLLGLRACTHTQTGLVMLQRFP